MLNTLMSRKLMSLLSSQLASAQFESQTKPAARIAPMSPVMKPSSTNGQRMNQLVAPTSRMISTSRRRAKMLRRTVVLMSSTAARAKMPVAIHMPMPIRLIVPSILRTVSRAYFTPLCVPGSLSTAGSSKNLAATIST
jgi:hypothetical protein